MTLLRFELPAPDLTRWRAGNTGIPGVWRFAASQPGPHVLITALVHGNELCGAWAVRHLLEKIVDDGQALLRGTLTLALCNLDAFDRFDPREPDRSRYVDEDLNRVWGDTLPANVTGPVPGTAERRRAQALREVVGQADWLLDLHSMHEPGDPLLLTGMLPHHLDFARTLDLPGHIVMDRGHTDGQRRRDHGRFGDPARRDRVALLVECGHHGDPRSRTVAMDAARRVLLHAGQLPEQAFDTTWHAPELAQRETLQVTHAVAARSMKVRFEPVARPLGIVPKAGTVIAHDGDEPVHTPYDDCVIVMPSLRQLRPGVTVMRLARRAGPPRQTR